MSDKRFVIKPSSIVTDGFVIIDKEKKYTFPVLGSTLNYMFCKALNELNEEKEQLKKQIGNLEHTRDFADEVCVDCERLENENEQLKFQLQNTSDQRDEFHRGARENANRVGKLKKENEQLRHDATILIQSNQDYRKENEQLKKQLMDCEKFRHTVFQEISKEMTQHD